MGYNSRMEDSKPSFSEFIGRYRDDVRRAWEELPKDKRADFMRVLGLMPRDVKGWRALIGQVVEHVRLAAGDKKLVAIVGTANVGKSTLYNTLIRSSGDRAQVSAVPGTTRSSQEADAGLFVVIDTPGADAVGAVGEEEKARALKAASGADLMIVLFDATHGIRMPEQELFSELKGIDVPMVIALNKIDLVTRERAKVVGKAAAALGLSSEQLMPVSAKKSQGIDRLLLAVAKSEPEIVAALGAALPQYRWDLAHAVIGRAASTAAAIAITPLPFLDFFPLTGVQVAMVLGIARIYAYKITIARARELIATFGVAILGRTLFYELSKLGGPPGWVVAAGVAAGTTVALGYAASIWFDRGERLSRGALARISRAVSQLIVDRLKDMGRRKPKRMTLRQRLDEVLQDLPVADETISGASNRVSD
jgi:small GTP-binding protein